MSETTPKRRGVKGEPAEGMTDAAWTAYLKTLDAMEKTGAFDAGKPLTAEELGLAEGEDDASPKPAPIKKGDTK